METCCLLPTYKSFCSVIGENWADLMEFIDDKLILVVSRLLVGVFLLAKCCSSIWEGAEVKLNGPKTKKQDLHTIK